MKTLKEFVNESLDLIEEAKGKKTSRHTIDKKYAIKTANEVLDNMDDYTMEENYDAAYELLLDIATNCSDSKIKQIASDALDNDKDDMDDRLGVFVDALEKIKNF